MAGFNEQIIDEFRAQGGVVTSHGFGDGLVLVHTRGARTGTPRVHPLMALPEGDGWLIAASAAGAPTDPAWAFNLRAHPDIEVEVGDGRGGVELVPARAVELRDPEHAAGWARFTEASPGFRAYEERAGDRRIPVFRLERR